VSPAADKSEFMPAAPRRRRRLHVLAGTLLFGLAAWLVLAYLVAPLGWRRYEKRHPALNNAPRITHTATGIPGDPINLGLVAMEDDLHRALLSADWFPADPITLKSSLRIAEATVLRRSYADAPVSSLYLFDRKEDLAFEQPVGDDPRRRHHVRFWRCEELDDDGRALWLGAATFDTRVGLSHTTGEITHHISPDVDAERDKVLADLKHAGALRAVYSVDGFQTTLAGKNGGGDPYRTDGNLGVGVIGSKGGTAAAAP
jgi:LssY C-terminus